MRPRSVALLVVPAVAACHTALRHPILTWGATETEAAARLPGDELLEDADGIATRAIDIEAPAAVVWPWLAQMGPAPRGGAYTYDWIENLLGLDMRSVDHILPEFQNPRVGDTIDFGSNSMRLERVERENVLALRSQDGDWVWTLVLEEHDGRTRLISRNRFRFPTLIARIGMVPMEPASLVMERKMLAWDQGARRAASPHDDSLATSPRSSRRVRNRHLVERGHAPYRGAHACDRRRRCASDVRGPIKTASPD
jgi:hypothetical protein